MKCIKCGSENVADLSRFGQEWLVCGDCGKGYKKAPAERQEQPD